MDVLSGMCIEEQRFLAKEAKAGKPISAKLYETRFRDEDKAWAKRERTSRDIDHFCERAEKGIGKFIGTVNGNWRDELNELIKFKADIGTYQRKQLIQVLKYASARAEQAARNLEIESSPVDIVAAEPKMIEGGPE